MHLVPQSTSGTSARAALSDEGRLADRFRAVRALTGALCGPLSAEDMVVQSMPDASPAKWHLAHTTWFFETFLLAPREPRFAPFHAEFSYLFNSYYDAVGPRHARAARGSFAPTLPWATGCTSPPMAGARGRTWDFATRR